MTDKTETTDAIITKAEVWDVVQFARGMSSTFGTGYYTQDLLNSRLKDVNLNPMQPTQDILDAAMLNPKSSEKQLREISQSFEVQSMVYKRLISYLSNMLAFDITYTSNAEEKDYSSAKFRKDNKVVEEFLENFAYKYELGIVVREMLRNDAYFGCPRHIGDKLVLQELPPEYCKITGRWTGGFTFSFDMYWFLQPGVNIQEYPKFFKEKYDELWNTSKTFKTNAGMGRLGLSGMTWDNWVEIPVDVGVCFKLSPELATRLPYFTPLFNDLILQGLMRNLQKNMNMAAASKMIMGEVPLLNRDTKASVRDSIAVSPELLGKFMALVKSALSDSVKVASAPLQEIEPISFETDNAMYDSYLRTALASSGINTNLIFSSSVKPNAIETQLSLNVDEQMMTALYEQFNLFLSTYVEKLTRTFKFKFELEGTDFTVNRKHRLDVALSLFDKGIVMPQKIAAAVGMRPSQMRKHMEESGSMNFMSMLTPPALEMKKEEAKLLPDPVAGGTASDKPATTAKKGRPRKDDSEISEDGLKSRETGSNVAKGGTV